jgi:membrane protein
MRRTASVVIDAVRYLFKRLVSDDLNNQASALAYRFFLALFPFLIFVVALSSFVASHLSVGDPAEGMLEMLGDIPSDLAALVRRELEGVVGREHPGLLSIGIAGTLWAASSGMNALMKAMDHAYRVEETRPLWRRYALAIGITLLAGTSLVGGFVVLVVGEVFGHQFAAWAGILELYEAVVNRGRWMAMAGLLVLAASVLYRAVPNVDLPWRLALPGAALFTVGWLLATYVLSLYIANFGSYSATYGTLGAAAILLIWSYVSSLLLLAGAELNAYVDERLDPARLETQRRQQPPRRQAAGEPDGGPG